MSQSLLLDFLRNFFLEVTLKCKIIVLEFIVLFNHFFVNHIMFNIMSDNSGTH